MDFIERYNRYIQTNGEILPNLGMNLPIGSSVPVSINLYDDLSKYDDVEVDIVCNNYLIQTYSLSGETLTIDSTTVTLDVDTSKFSVGVVVAKVKMYIDSYYTESKYILGTSK